MKAECLRKPERSWHASMMNLLTLIDQGPICVLLHREHDLTASAPGAMSLRVAICIAYFCMLESALAATTSTATSSYLAIIVIHHHNLGGSIA